MYTYILRLIALMIFISLFSINTYASSYEKHIEHTQQKKVEHSHTTHTWELGLALGYANLVTEDEEGTSIHLHLLKRLEGKGWQQYVSLGFGVETIVSDEIHYGAMLTLAFHPIEDFVISISPGFEWANHEDEWERHYATHIEIMYSFDMANGYHMGPVLGYSKTNESEHYNIGLHLGIPF